MLKKLLLTILFLFVSVPVFAADWVQLDTKLYADAGSIRKYNGYYTYNRPILYTVWLKWLNDKSNIWKEMETNAGKKLWYNMQLAVVDCENNEFAIRSVSYYDLTGNVVGKLSSEYSYFEWNSVVPDSVGETIYNFTCAATLSK